MSSGDDVLTNERLSAYLDGELGPDEARSLERLLAAHPENQERLEGLRRVVGGLRRLERSPVPPTLHHSVALRVRHERDRVSWLDRLEASLSSLRSQNPLLATFAVVISLAMFIVFFSINLDRAERGRIVVVDSSQHAVGARMERAGRVLFWTGDAWSEGGVRGAPYRWIDLAADEGQQWLAEHPDLAPFTELAEPAEVVVDGERIRLRPRPPAGG